MKRVSWLSVVGLLVTAFLWGNAVGESSGTSWTGQSYLPTGFILSVESSIPDGQDGNGAYTGLRETFEHVLEKRFSSALAGRGMRDIRNDPGAGGYLPGSGEHVLSLGFAYSGFVVGELPDGSGYSFSAQVDLKAQLEGSQAGEEVILAFRMAGTGLTPAGAVEESGNVLEHYLDSIIRDLPFPEIDSRVEHLYTLSNATPFFLSESENIEEGDIYIVVSGNGSAAGAAEVVKVEPVTAGESAEGKSLSEKAVGLQVLYTEIPVSTGTVFIPADFSGFRLEVGFSIGPGMMEGLVAGDMAKGDGFSPLASISLLHTWDNPYTSSDLFTVTPDILAIQGAAGFRYRITPPRNLNQPGLALFSRLQISLDAGLSAGYCLQAGISSSISPGFMYGSFLAAGADWILSPVWSLAAGVRYNRLYHMDTGENLFLSALSWYSSVTIRL